jgi:hypothetical protein
LTTAEKGPLGEKRTISEENQNEGEEDEKKKLTEKATEGERGHQQQK